MSNESLLTAPASIGGARWRYDWSIDVYTGPSLTELRSLHATGRPALMGSDPTDITAQSVADPFLLVHDDRWFLFFEVWNASTDRGEVAYATSQDGLSWKYEAVVLREPFHVSYPQVFAADGAVFMIPETRQDLAVHLYVAEDFPRGWRKVATLLRGPFADATVVQHDGRWWLFAQRGLDEMRLYSSRSLESAWTEHPCSPLWPGNRRFSRPGGRIVRDEGRLVRFAQDAWPSYGFCVRALAIETLTPAEYEEHEIPGSPILRASRTGWNAAAMHHLDAVRRADGSWLAVVDGAVARAH